MFSFFKFVTIIVSSMNFSIFVDRKRRIVHLLINDRNRSLSMIAIVQRLCEGRTSPSVMTGNITWYKNFCEICIEASPSFYTLTCGCRWLPPRNALSPCASQGYWGEMNSVLCYSPSQTITLTIQWSKTHFYFLHSEVLKKEQIFCPLNYFPSENDTYRICGIDFLEYQRLSNEKSDFS